MDSKKISLLSRFWKWIKGLFSGVNKKTNKSNKEGKSVNSDQITGEKNVIYKIINNNQTYNIHNCDEVHASNKISSPDIEKVQKGKIEKDAKNIRTDSEKDQEMPQQEFENLLMKVKFIAFGVMGNIKWEKVEPLKFWKEKGEEFAKLAFEVEKKWCWIAYEITEKDKQKFLQTSAFEIVERFITQRLVNYGKNDYFDYHCPDCKQTTLTKSLVVNSPIHEEAICCNLCGWAMSMKVYLEYVNDKNKKNNSSLEFYEWLGERNRRMARIRRERTKNF